MNEPKFPHADHARRPKRFQQAVSAILATAGIAVLISGCGPSADSDSANPGSDDPPPAVNPPDASAPVESGSSATTPAAVGALAVQSLARRLQVAPDAIRVVRAESVTWPSSALGCPVPDSAYLQVLSPGFRIELAHAGQRHHFHAGKDGIPFECPDDRVQAPVQDARELT